MQAMIWEEGAEEKEPGEEPLAGSTHSQQVNK